MNRIAAVTLGVIFCLAIDGCHQQSSKEPVVAPPKMQGPRISEGDVATEPPFVGRAGSDQDGYPASRPDKVKLLSLLRYRRFAGLDRFISFYQDAFERDYRCEEWPDGAASAFFVADPALEPILNEWVTRNPPSFAAFLARGTYRYRLGWHYRGHAWASDTRPEQFRAMDDQFAAARKDLQRAIELRPRLVAAYRRLLQISGIQAGGGSGPRGILESALASCPLCYEIRAELMENLTPRWGGSYEAMDQFWKETEPRVRQNPKLRLLEGFAAWDRCNMSLHGRRYAEAHRACDAALAVGDDPRFLNEKAMLLRMEERKQEALLFLDRVLSIEPHDRTGLEQRYFVRLALENVAGAGEDLIAMRSLDPTASWMAEQVDWMVSASRYYGHQLESAGKHVEAARFFSMGLQLAPDDTDLMRRMASSQRASGQSAAAVAEDLKAAPDDFQLRRRIDYGLAAAQRFEEVIPMWDEFISRHPTDPRAFSERAGAHWHLGHTDVAIADMERACALGMEKACQDAHGMKARGRPRVAPGGSRRTPPGNTGAKD